MIALRNGDRNHGRLWRGKAIQKTVHPTGRAHIKTLIARGDASIVSGAFTELKGYCGHMLNRRFFKGLGSI